jgi:hypothetical protein
MLEPIIFGAFKKWQVKKESKMNKNDFVIRSSITFVLFLIIFSVILATILILLNVFDSFETGSQFLITNVCVIPIIVLFLLGAFGAARKRIVVKNDKISITPMYGKKIESSFEEITKIREKVWYSKGIKFYSYDIYTTKKLYSISASESGFNLFIQTATEKGIYIETIAEQKEKLK